jgi:hypothetical protein
MEYVFKESVHKTVYAVVSFCVVMSCDVVISRSHVLHGVQYIKTQPVTTILDVSYTTTSNYKMYACIVRHNYVLGGMLFIICKAQLHVSAINVGHLQVVDIAHCGQRVI